MADVSCLPELGPIGIGLRPVSSELPELTQTSLLPTAAMC
jgi:hypothetical protein